MIDAFVRSYAQEFEFRRRDWLRAAVAADDNAVARQLARADLPPRLRRPLSATPLDVSTVLADRYIDALVDPRDTDGWLPPDAQTELDAIPQEILLRYQVLRQTRNLLVHNSNEARTRLTERLQELAAVQPAFELRQPLTPRVLLDWFNAADARRLRLLLDCVADIWRAKLIAESLVLSPPAARMSAR